MDWQRARFADCVLHRGRHELRRAGRAQPVGARSLQVLAQLIDQRHRVVSKADLLAACWDGEAGSEGALARTVMKLRQAISDLGEATPMIRTTYGVGYRFEAPVQLDPAEGDDLGATGVAALPEAQAPRLSLLVLPLHNDTHDGLMAWVELGLVTMIVDGLAGRSGISVVALDRCLAALGSLRPDTPVAQRLEAARQRLRPDLIVCGRVAGGAGGHALHLQLWSNKVEVQPRSLAVLDVGTLAHQAVEQIGQWLDQIDLRRCCGPDFADPFLEQTWQRALQCSNRARKEEATHLVELLLDAGVDHNAVLLEAALLHTMVADPRAHAELEALAERALAEQRLADWSHVQWLRARWLRRQGASDAAAVLAAQAADAAERAGDEALAVRALLMRADCLGRQLDPAAASVQSNTVVRAERLGHQGLLRNCHVVSSRLCGYQQQWTAAVVHARDALETAQLIDEAVHCEPLSTLSRAQRQLGLLDDAAANGLQSMRCARLSMDVTDAGNAAMSAMGALLSAYRIDEAMALYRELKRLPGQDALTLYTAVEVLCKGSFLCATRREAACRRLIAQARQRASREPVVRGHADALELRLLMLQGHWNELLQRCHMLTDGPTPSARLDAWVERCRALHVHFVLGRTAAALARLHDLFYRLPASEFRGRLGLEVAWLHLEQGDVEAAKRMAAGVPSWTEQSLPGQLVQLRIEHDTGCFVPALERQQALEQRFSDMLLEGVAPLLRACRQAVHSRCRQDIAALPLPLGLALGVLPAWALDRIPAELGGTGFDEIGSKG